MSDTAEASEYIEADPGLVYDLVSDLPAMGRWSPEATGGRWLDGVTEAATGARFRGSNKSGWRRWSTTVEVTAAERGRRFAFHVTYGPLDISDWLYEFAATSTGTTVTERWTDRRPGWMRVASAPLMGVADRGAHNRATMEHTLRTLKRGAETQTAS